MKYKCPNCGKKIESAYLSAEVMREIFDHEKTHK